MPPFTAYIVGFSQRETRFQRVRDQIVKRVLIKEENKVHPIMSDMSQS